MHDSFHVTTKVAFYSPDRRYVLMIHITGQDGYGLPGGHLEANEQPDEAMARELYEEVGVQNVLLERKDFFRHGNGKVVLAYTGTLDTSAKLGSTQNESEGDPTWVSRSEFENIDTDDSYRQFISKNW